MIKRQEPIAAHPRRLGSLVTRTMIGWACQWSEWGKPGRLPQVIENFRGSGVPTPKTLSSFFSGPEFARGVLLILDLFTRIFSSPSIVVMIVAIKTVFRDQVVSLEYLLGLSEFATLAIFLWLSTAGPGAVSLDHLFQRHFGSTRC